MACANVTNALPVSAFQVDFLNSNIRDFDSLTDRIARQLGYPMISIDLHRDQIYDNIAIAVELFTKYAGFKEEFLVFDSDIYEPGKGIKLDNLFSITPTLCATYTSNEGLSGGYDSLLRLTRKVRTVHGFEEGTTTGINTLFTIEQSLAQQTYFTYSMGNYGFDLISWHVLKDWLETREKLLATRQSFLFDPDTQYLQLIPEPTNTHFYGIVSCYVNKHLKYILKEPWIMQYALALCKITIGHIRGRFTGTTLFGGGQVNHNDMMSQGLTEKAALEEKLFNGSAAGFGDSAPISFFLG